MRRRGRAQRGQPPASVKVQFYRSAILQLERLRCVPTPDHSQLMRVGRAARPTSDAPETANRGFKRCTSRSGQLTVSTIVLLPRDAYA